MDPNPEQWPTVCAISRRCRCRWVRSIVRRFIAAEFTGRRYPLRWPRQIRIIQLHHIPRRKHPMLLTTTDAEKVDSPVRSTVWKDRLLPAALAAAAGLVLLYGAGFA